MKFSVSYCSLSAVGLIQNELIHIDHDFWNTKIYSKLEEFYMKNMLAEIASPRHTSDQPVRKNAPFVYRSTTHQ